MAQKAKAQVSAPIEHAPEVARPITNYADAMLAEIVEDAGKAVKQVVKDGASSKVFETTMRDDKGQIVPVSMHTALGIQTMSTLKALVTVENTSGKAIAIEASRITDKVAKAEGFDSAEKMLTTVLYEKSWTTLRAYRRVGKVFGVREETPYGVHYRWRNGIDDRTSVSNLMQVVGLVNLGDIAFDDLTTEQVATAYGEFYERFIASDELHPLLSQKGLRDELTALAKVVNEDGSPKFPELSEYGKGTKGRKASKDAGKGDGKDASKGDVVTPERAARDGLDAIVAYLAGVEGAGEHVAAILHLIEEKAQAQEQAKAQEQETENK